MEPTTTDMTPRKRGWMLETGVQSRLTRFFEANPNEELSYRDAAAKFDCSEQAVRDAVKKMRCAGTAEFVRVIRPIAKRRAP